MKVLGINGSPRKNGNTAELLNVVLNNMKDKGWDSEFIQVGGEEIRGCLACSKCNQRTSLQCIITKDIFNSVFEKMLIADAIVIGSPTYFGDVSAEVKALLDRSGSMALANGSLFRGKIGAAVIAVRRGGGIHAFDTINHMYLMSQMIVPGSVYWNLGFGFKKEEVKEDKEGINNMKNLAETIDWLGRAIEPHKASFPAGPVW